MKIGSNGDEGPQSDVINGAGIRAIPDGTEGRTSLDFRQHCAALRRAAQFKELSAAEKHRGPVLDALLQLPLDERSEAVREVFRRTLADRRLAHTGRMSMLREQLRNVMLERNHLLRSPE